MHSKWQIWDFFKNVERGFLSNFEGILILNTFDSISLKMIKDYLIHKNLSRPVLHKTFQEITKSWIESEYETLSLFPNDDCFFIHQAQELNSDLIDKIFSLNLSRRFLILSFENSTLKKKMAGNSIHVFEIEAPKFWESNKLLDFISLYFNLGLSFEVKSWILDSFENNLSSFYHICSVLKINFPDAQLTLQEAKEVISPNKFDQFVLASLVSQKQTEKFYQTLNSLEQDFEKMRDLFRFLQSHFIKLSDASFTKGKSKLSQYDRDLVKMSVLWNRDDLKHLIRLFDHFEILAKKKDSQLWIDLKSHQLASEFKF
jgi:hypothetical protein